MTVSSSVSVKSEGTSTWGGGERKSEGASTWGGLGVEPGVEEQLCWHDNN
jgi:hypothetical protein